MRRRSLQPGFNLIELLCAIIILTIFFAVAGKIFNSTVLLSAAGENISDASARTDSALYQLRSDVWNAATITVAGPRSISLTQPDGRQISWTIDPELGLTRAGSQLTSEHWQSIAADWIFATDGYSLSISQKQEIPVRLVSQILLAPSSQS